MAADDSPLGVLAAATGRGFPHLFQGRERTRSGLADRRASLRRLDHGGDASIVLMGSWGRAEVTTGSDDDFMVLVHGPEGANGAIGRGDQRDPRSSAGGAGHLCRSGLQ